MHMDNMRTSYLNYKLPSCYSVCTCRSDCIYLALQLVHLVFLVRMEKFCFVQAENRKINEIHSETFNYFRLFHLRLL